MTLSRRDGLLAVVALAQLIIALDYNIVYVALPEIGEKLGFAPRSLQWVVSAYAVAFGGLLLLGGRASDLLDRRRVLVAGLGMYAISSLLGGLATSPALLVAGRVGQGVGGALLFPATLTLIATVFPAGPERNRALSVWGAAGASGMIVGSLAGGVLTDAFGWQAVFLVNLPLAGLAIAGAFAFIEPAPPCRAEARVDVAGALTATAGVTLLVVTLVQGPDAGWSAVDASLGATAAALLGAFVIVERRAAAPLVTGRLVGDRNLQASMAITFIFMGTIGTSLYFLTVYFQVVHGFSPLRAGLAFATPTLATVAGSMAAGQIASRLGLRRTLAIGAVASGAGCLLVAATLGVDSAYTAVLPGLVVFGAGQGVVYTLMFAAATVSVDGSDAGAASGLASTTQQIGGAVGLAVLVAATTDAGAVVERGIAAHNDGVRQALLLIAAGVALMLVAIARLRPDALGGTGDDDDVVVELEIHARSTLPGPEV